MHHPKMTPKMREIAGAYWSFAPLEAVAGGEQWRGLQGQQGDQKWQVVWPCRPLAGLALFGSL